MSDDIFISFAAPDLAFVQQLQEALAARDISAWYDTEVENNSFDHRTMVDAKLAESSILLVVLSGASVKLPKIKNQLRAAKRQNDQVILLTWEATPIPDNAQALFEDHEAELAFNGDASDANFDQLAQVLKARLGNALVQESAQVAPRRRLGGQSNQPAASDAVSPVAVGLRLQTALLNSITLDSDSQAIVKTELAWLFRAADHLLQVQHGAAKRDQALAVPIPADAVRLPEADNRILASVEDFWLPIWADTIRSQFKAQIPAYLKNLTTLLEREAKFSEVGRYDTKLQEDIADQKVALLKGLQTLAADIIFKSYGVTITAPQDLIDYLKGTVEPVPIAVRIGSTIIPTFELGEDEDWVREELTWLFQAIDHFLRVQAGEAAADSSIAVSMPPDAETIPEANNHLLSAIPDYELANAQGALETGLRNLNVTLNILTRRLDQEAAGGEAGRHDTQLQKLIQDARVAVVRTIREMAGIVSKLYGVYVTSPKQLLDSLE